MFKRRGIHDRVSTVALIGPDGTGKTTIAKALVSSGAVPMRYLYMGMSIESSNLALPTSRLIHRIKLRAHKRSLRQSGQPSPEDLNLHGLEHRADRRGRIGAAARLVHWLAEETYRQMVSWAYQRRGYLVVYDRHFIFDDLPGPSARLATRRLTDRIHNWFLYTLYPRPDLVILLDAPVEVLYSRKQEVPPWYLQQNREQLLEKREYAPKWIQVDASKPLAEVIETVSAAVHSRKPAGA